MPMTSPDVGTLVEGRGATLPAHLGGWSTTLGTFVALFPRFEEQLQRQYKVVVDFDNRANKEGSLCEHRVYLWSQFWRALLTSAKGTMARWLHRAAEKTGGSVDIYGLGIGKFLEDHATILARYSGQQRLAKQKALNQDTGEHMRRQKREQFWAALCSRCWRCSDKPDDERLGFLAQPTSLSSWKTLTPALPFRCSYAAKVMLPLIKLSITR